MQLLKVKRPGKDDAYLVGIAVLKDIDELDIAAQQQSDIKSRETCLEKTFLAAQTEQLTACPSLH